jgi:subfamily B ATP-binding cassette protein MsbA
MFKKYLRVLSYVKPFWVSALMNVIFNLLVIIFSLVSFVMLIPFLNLLFGIEKLVDIKPGISLSPESILDYINYYISQVIINKGKFDALLYICFFLLTTFFCRNLFRFLAMYNLATVRIGAVESIRNETYRKLTILPLSYYTGNKKGDIIARITTIPS